MEVKTANKLNQSYDIANDCEVSTYECGDMRVQVKVEYGTGKMTVDYADHGKPNLSVAGAAIGKLDYKQRAAQEYHELEVRHSELHIFITRDGRFNGLHPVDQSLLQDQYYGMTLYLNALGKRIERFTYEA